MTTPGNYPEGPPNDPSGSRPDLTKPAGQPYGQDPGYSGYPSPPSEPYGSSPYGSPQQPNYGAPPPGYGNPPAGYGPPPQGYGAPMGIQGDPSAPYGRDPITGEPLSDKSKLVAGLLQILLGGFGAGRFYLGYNGIAIGQIAATWLTCGLGVIWPIIDGIMILMGNVRDSRNLPLKD